MYLNESIYPTVLVEWKVLFQQISVNKNWLGFYMYFLRQKLVLVNWYFVMVTVVGYCILVGYGSSVRFKYFLSLNTYLSSNFYVKNLLQHTFLTPFLFSSFIFLKIVKKKKKSLRKLFVQYCGQKWQNFIDTLYVLLPMSCKCWLYSIKKLYNKKNLQTFLQGIKHDRRYLLHEQFYQQWVPAWHCW